jgi:hypothetical protein
MSCRHYTFLIPFVSAASPAGVYSGPLNSHPSLLINASLLWYPGPERTPAQANPRMGYKRFVEIGRVTMLNYGSDYGKLCVIMDHGRPYSYPKWNVL